MGLIIFLIKMVGNICHLLQIFIPKPNIITEFLKQSSIERATYDSALGEKD